ncbi:hypothetical protein HDV01_005708 [Terramyces sp. JEL0728]|nr:hypothetical protein HDV01_005708 [Terramyces sp. JEL0728]
MKNYSYFSNFYPDTKFKSIPFSGFKVDGITFPTVEFYFQYTKFKTLGTDEAKAYAQLILKCADSKQVKQMASKGAYIGFVFKYLNKVGNPKITKKTIKREFETFIEDIWKPMTKDVMYIGLKEKFSDENLKEKLLETAGMELGEKKSWPKPSYWTRGGGNMLGILLMKVRDEILAE